MRRDNSTPISPTGRNASTPAPARPAERPVQQPRTPSPHNEQGTSDDFNG